MQEQPPIDPFAGSVDPRTDPAFDKAGSQRGRIDTEPFAAPQTGAMPAERVAFETRGVDMRPAEVLPAERRPHEVNPPESRPRDLRPREFVPREFR